MSKSLELVNKAYQTLKEYNGENSYIIDLKNSIFAYKSSTLNDFQVEFILRNYDKEPIIVENDRTAFLLCIFLLFAVEFGFFMLI